MIRLVDDGCALEEQQRVAALQAQAERAGLDGKTVDDSATHCHLCEEPIPQGRREAYPGVQTCIACQQELEYSIVSAGD